MLLNEERLKHFEATGGGLFSERWGIKKQPRALSLAGAKRRVEMQRCAITRAGWCR